MQNLFVSYQLYLTTKVQIILKKAEKSEIITQKKCFCPDSV
jgi:hypothetical protein